MRHLFLICGTTLATVAAVVACSSSPALSLGTDAGTDETNDTPPPSTTGPVVTPDAAPTTTLEPAIYAHSATTLYRFSATTNTLSTIASFSGCTGDVTDLAIAADGTAYVATFSQFAKVNLTTAVCTPITNVANGPNSLGFVSDGAGGQQLVTYFGATYERVDPATANLTPLGTLGGGYQSSGDISTFDGGAFLSAYGGPCSDCLFQIDPLTGVRLQSFGDLGIDEVYGLAASSSALYGFSGEGVVVRAVPLGDGGMTTAIVFDAGTPSFYGAASGPAAQ